MNSHPPIWRRFAAIVYDSFLVTAISMAYGGISLFIYQKLTGSEDMVSGVLFQLGWLATIALFFCFFWQRIGQTLGMKAWRLKILQRETEYTPTTLQCLIRLTLAPVGLLLFFTAFFREDKQCLHDIISKTQVTLTEKDK